VVYGDGKVGTELRNVFHQSCGREGVERNRPLLGAVGEAGGDFPDAIEYAPRVLLCNSNLVGQ